MLTGREWTYDDIVSRRVQVMLTSCGVATDQTDRNELVAENGYGVRRLTLSESIMWYGLTFDAIEYDECCRRYERSAQNLRITPEPAASVLFSLMNDDFICMGAEPDRSDALFSMFCSGGLSRAMEQQEMIKMEKHCSLYYDRYLHWDKVEQSPRRREPLSDDERKALDMLTAENWSAAELARNFEKGYDSSLCRCMVPHEKYGILSVDPYADLVRMNYERHPAARKVAGILLNLLRSRRVMMY